MTFVVDGTNGLTFNDATTQSSTATNASNISSGTLGKARLPTGSVLQVVNATISTAQSTSSASATATGLTASITPSSSANKILVLMNSVCGQNYSGRSEFLYLYKNGSQVFRYELFLNTVSAIPLALNYLDSPATTSATTYAIYFSADGLGPATFSNGNTVSSLTLMEISA
jgi:hypothetical protein